MYYSEMPGMPNMQMYSREEMMEEMAKQKSMQSEDESEADNSEYTQYAGGDLSIWETIVQTFRDFWNWIKKLLEMRNKANADL